MILKQLLVTARSNSTVTANRFVKIRRSSLQSALNFVNSEHRIVFQYLIIGFGWFERLIDFASASELFTVVADIILVDEKQIAYHKNSYDNHRCSLRQFAFKVKP